MLGSAYSHYNSEKSSFVGDMGRGLRDLPISLRNMIFVRKLKGVIVLNSTGSLTSGAVTLCIQAAAAYKRLAEKLAASAASLTEEPEHRPPTASAGSRKRKTYPRDQWVAGPQLVAPLERTWPGEGAPRRARFGRSWGVPAAGVAGGKSKYPIDRNPVP